VGPGISIKTPIGQLQLDWGYRLNPVQEWGSIAVNLGQGF
jgi:hypothetical protein